MSGAHQYKPNELNVEMNDCFFYGIIPNQYKILETSAPVKNPKNDPIAINTENSSDGHA